MRRIAPVPKQALHRVFLSPLGAVPKKNSLKFRTIHNLSFPHGHSINDNVVSLPARKYATVDDAANVLCAVGQGCFLSKLDIRDAYRLIPIHPHDRQLLGFSWKNVIYVDLCLPFGLRNSPPLFESFAEHIEWILRHRFGVSKFVRYVDDFLFFGKSREDCAADLQKCCTLLDDIGVPVNTDKLKSEGDPRCVQSFLGIELDSTSLTARISKDRIHEIWSLADQWLHKTECTRQELQSLIGKLMFASKVVTSSRTFVQRCISAVHAFDVLSPSAHRPISDEIKADLRWWIAFLSKWNGVALLLEPQPSTGWLTSDASMLGFGAACGNRWISGRWPQHVLDLARRSKRESLPFLELYALTTAVLSFAPYLQRKRLPITVKLLSDSKTSVDCLCAGYSKDSAMLALIRELHFVCASYSFKIYPAFISGASNILADALSRLQITRYKELLPSADHDPSPVTFPTMMA